MEQDNLWEQLRSALRAKCFLFDCNYALKSLYPQHKSEEGSDFWHHKNPLKMDFYDIWR